METESCFQSETVSGSETCHFDILEFKEFICQLFNIFRGDWNFEAVLSSVAATTDPDLFLEFGIEMQEAVHEMQFFQVYAQVWL